MLVASIVDFEVGADNIAVDKYVVYVNGKRYSRPKYTSVSITGLDPATTYQIELETLDTSGNASERVVLQASTHSNTTDILQPATNTPKTIYTLSGQPVTTTPVGQVHIVQSGHTTSKQIKQ